MSVRTRTLSNCVCPGKIITFMFVCVCEHVCVCGVRIPSSVSKPVFSLIYLYLIEQGKVSHLNWRLMIFLVYLTCSSNSLYTHLLAEIMGGSSDPSDIYLDAGEQNSSHYRCSASDLLDEPTPQGQSSWCYKLNAKWLTVFEWTRKT